MRHRAVDLGVGHLAGKGALPDKFVEFFLGGIATGGLHHHVGRANGFVRLLGSGALGGVAAGLSEVGSVHLGDGAAGAVYGFVRQVHRVGTHVGDVSVLIEFLCQAHGAAHGHSELARRLLLQG